VLKPTIELGLLDGPSAHPFGHLGPDDIDTAEYRQLALEAGQQAITLLKNDKPVGMATPLLPLGSSVGAASNIGTNTDTIALIGPALNFTQEMLANYHGWNTVVNHHSPWAALQARLGSRIVSSALGCGRRVVSNNMVSCDVMNNGTSGIPAAVAAAKAAHTVLLFVGTNPIGNVVSCPATSSTCRVTTEAEAVDRDSLELPGVQGDLVKAVLAANPNTVLVMLNAGPLAIDWAAVHVPAIVEAYFPGELGGDAIASVLMGDVSPTGRLPVTVYPADYIERNMTDYDLASGNGTTHLYYKGTPLFPFGFGKSYSTFSFALHDADTDQSVTYFSAEELVGKVSSIVYHVRVTNTGKRPSAVSVLVLISSDHEDAVTNEKLVDFGKTAELQPGAFEVLTLRIANERLALVDEKGDESIAPGDYRVRIGGAGSSSAAHNLDFLEIPLRVTGKKQPLWELSGARRRWQEATAPSTL
jgi:beta-glucosidase